MNNKSFWLIQSLFVLMITIFHQKGESSIMENVTLRDNLFQIQWMEEISNSEKEIIQIGLKSNDSSIQIEALKAIAVHSLVEFKNELSNSELNSKSLVLSNLKAHIFTGLQNTENISKYLEKKISPSELTTLRDKSRSRHYMDSLSDILVSILVTIKTKRNREGEIFIFNLNETWLSDYQKKLLDLSEVPKEDVFNQIYNEISSTNIIGGNESNLSRVLISYGEYASIKILERVTKLDSLKKTSPYGRILLLQNLKHNVRLLSRKDKQRLDIVLKDKDIKMDYFEEPASLKVVCIFLEESIQPEVDYGKIKTRMEGLRDIDKEEEFKKALIEKIHGSRNVQEPEQKENPSPPRTLQEEEDLSLLSTNMVFINLLKINKEELCKGLNHKNEDCVKLRTVAQELGDRHLKGNLSLNAEQRIAIDNTVKEYLKLVTSEEDNDWEEAKLQMYRFWTLAAPMLLKNMDHSDKRIARFAAQTLIEMRDEQIIKKIIEKANTNTNSRKEKFYILTLEMMKNQFIIQIPNRQSMSKEETEKTYNELIEPALKKLKKK